MNDRMHQFYVIETETEHRRKAKDDYIICLNPEIKKQLQIGRFAVITHVIIHEEKQKLIKVHCQVISDKSLLNSQLRTDQSVRNAIGIPFEYDKKATMVEVYKLKLTLFQFICEFLSRLLGRRYLFLRTNKADIPDLEKNLARIPQEAFKLLGTTVSNRIVLESVIKNANDEYVLKKFHLKAFTLSSQILERRKKIEEESPERYPNAEKILKIKPDIWPIYLDAHGRVVLKIDSLDAVKVRRDLYDLFLNEFREFGVIFFLSLVAIIQIFPIKITWWLLIPISIISILISLGLILVNIRAKVK